MSPPGTTTPNMPSTYIIGVAGIIEAAATGVFLTDAGLSTHAVTAVVAFGAVLGLLGAWLHTIGH
jgi:hypothetical protein